ncbi:MAG TPA: nucleotidyltransferase domain-containing protein [Candidatus Aenigmarchaeota archaeon]|nr:nucleotidyltransferase domain-containing protein [Candidatus Aenigmarchaeota archaeon]
MEIEKLEEELKKPIVPKKEEIYELEVSEKKFKEKKELYTKVIDFTTKVRKMYGEIIKSVLVFGSAARGDMKPGSDIDLWVILDDTATKGSEDLEKIKASLHLIANELKDLHIQTTNLTEFWRWVKIGSPELFNFLRYGLPIYDCGFIKPVQRMLLMGLIPPSEEVIVLKSKSAEARIKKIELTLKSMIFDLRYAALDACQSVVMYFYKEQPDAKKMPIFLQRLIDEKKLEKEYLDKFKELNKLWKDIDHEVIKEVKVEHLARAMELASSIVERMKKLLPKDLSEEFPLSI